MNVLVILHAESLQTEKLNLNKYERDFGVLKEQGCSIQFWNSILDA